MNDIWLRRIAWVLACAALLLLGLSAILLLAAEDTAGWNWLESQVKAFTTLGAPILGLVIVGRQPRHRVGWLWIVYGVAVGHRTLGHGIYYYYGSQPSGYSSLEHFFLWVTEPANLVGLMCLTLLMLWFPDGQLPSRRWRFLYAWMILATLLLLQGSFEIGPNWNGGANAGGIVIDNPYGWLPPANHVGLGFLGIISIVLIMVFAALSLFFRYRSTGQAVRLQIRWFVLGGLLLVGLTFVPLFYIGEHSFDGVSDFILGILSFSAILPLYLAVGIAILRYHLYDIDVIINKTLVYTLLSGVLAMVYFGSIVMIQQLFRALTGQESQFAIVVSTLTIATLFNPLRYRIQDFIDRRFYRRKYDAQKTLAAFSVSLRSSTSADLEQLTGEVVRVIEETVQPTEVSLWLRPTADGKQSHTARW